MGHQVDKFEVLPYLKKSSTRQIGKGSDNGANNGK